MKNRKLAAAKFYILNDLKINFFMPLVGIKIIGF